MLKENTLVSPHGVRLGHQALGVRRNPQRIQFGEQVFVMGFGLNLSITFSNLPSLPTIKVVRMSPMNSLPMNFFMPQHPYFSAVA